MTLIWSDLVEPTADQIAAEIRSELRSIIRQIEDARMPVNRFRIDESRTEGGPRYYVDFDSRPRRRFTGLRTGMKSLSLPDERIMDAYMALAKSVWQLKDRLKLWVRAQSLPLDIEAEANKCQNLLLCADLANLKKHGENRNRSGRDPKVELVTFDTSASGCVELFYDGVSKEKELIVTNALPIPFRIEVTRGIDGVLIGDALQIIVAGFSSWVPMVRACRVLDGDNSEAEHLRLLLFASDTPTHP